MKTGIYKITSPSGKIYIGQSKNIYKRWLAYKRLHCKTQPKIYNSLKKYGAKNHKFEIVAYCDKSELNELELYYIDLFESCNLKVGLNCDRTSESKLHSYKLQYNERRLKKERKLRKRELNLKYAEKLKNQSKEYLMSLEYLIDINNMKCPLTGNQGFILNNPPINLKKEYLFPSLVPF